MRFDTAVFFQIIEPGEFDAASGNYQPDKETEIKRYASITDSGLETLNLVYGELRRGSLTIRLQNHFTDSFDKIRIGKREYHVDFQRALRSGSVFVVSEVQ